MRRLRFEGSTSHRGFCYIPAGFQILIKTIKGQQIVCCPFMSEWPDSNGRPLAPHARMLANCTTPRVRLRLQRYKGFSYNYPLYEKKSYLCTK